MKKITEFVKYELVPAIFDNIQTLLPELQFEWKGNKWASPLKLNGAKPKKRRPDKTVITKEYPHLILEQGEAPINVIEYIKQRDGIDFIPAVKRLAESVGLKLPQGDYNEEQYSKIRDIETLLQDLNNYFVYLLLEDNTGGSQRDRVLQYLKEVRGYAIEDIRKMGLGYTPNKNRIKKYLTQRKYNKEQIDEAMSMLSNSGIGQTHKISIPYSIGGYIKGFKIRSIDDSVTPKYLNTTGLTRNEGFFNIRGIKGDKDIVIVEGELDCLHATAKGISNVVATGGSSINIEQIRDALKRGVRTFTILFDTEATPEARETTHKKIERAIDIMAEETSNIYVATLPTGTDIETEKPTKIDPDSFIKNNGVEALKKIINKAVPYYEYKRQRIISKYSTGEGVLLPKDLIHLTEELNEVGAQIKDQTHKDIYINSLVETEYLKAYGISREAIENTIDKLKYNKDKEAQQEAFKHRVQEAQKLQNKGAIGEAIEYITGKLHEIKIKDKEVAFTKLFKPQSEEEIKKELQRKGEGIDTGYYLDEKDPENNPFILPSGAITIISAPTSHGKTTFLLNIAINIAKKNNNVLFYSYEEDKLSILCNALNVYIGVIISANNRRSIRSYFEKGTEEYIFNQQQESFKKKKDEFMRDLYNSHRLGIEYTDFDVLTLVESIRYMNQRREIGAILIDYIQLLRLPAEQRKGFTRQEELKQICLILKDTAVETGIPIVLGSQFNREVTSPTLLHPTKLGEAGDIERVAHLLIGFWNTNFKPSENKISLDVDLDFHNDRDKLYLTVLKNRGGRVNTYSILNFDGNKGRIWQDKAPQSDFLNEGYSKP